MEYIKFKKVENIWLNFFFITPHLKGKLPQIPVYCWTQCGNKSDDSTYIYIYIYLGYAKIQPFWLWLFFCVSFPCHAVIYNNRYFIRYFPIVELTTVTPEGTDALLYSRILTAVSKVSLMLSLTRFAPSLSVPSWCLFFLFFFFFSVGAGQEFLETESKVVITTHSISSVYCS